MYQTGQIQDFETSRFGARCFVIPKPMLYDFARRRENLDDMRAPWLISKALRPLVLKELSKEV